MASTDIPRQSQRPRPHPYTYQHLRRPDWAIRFVEFMADSLQLQNDLQLDWEFVSCTSWAGDCVEALTGSNPFDDFRGRFNSVAKAVRVIREAGFNSLDELMLSLFKEIPLGMATQGDLVLAASARSSAVPYNLGPNNPLPQSDGGIHQQDLYAPFGLLPSEWQVMPNAVGIADPPHFWVVTPQGLGKGPLMLCNKALAVGRII